MPLHSTADTSDQKSNSDKSARLGTVEVSDAIVGGDSGHLTALVCIEGRRRLYPSHTSNGVCFILNCIADVGDI